MRENTVHNIMISVKMYKIDQLTELIPEWMYIENLEKVCDFAF